MSQPILNKEAIPLLWLFILACTYPIHIHTAAWPKYPMLSYHIFIPNMWNWMHEFLDCLTQRTVKELPVHELNRFRYPLGDSERKFAAMNFKWLLWSKFTLAGKTRHDVMGNVICVEGMCTRSSVGSSSSYMSLHSIVKYFIIMSYWCIHSIVSYVQYAMIIYEFWLVPDIFQRSKQNNCAWAGA